MSNMCNVKNRSASTVVYRIPESGIRRSFAPGETKKISYEELEKLTFQPGGTALLAAYLQIQDEVALKASGIKTEPEYHMSEADIRNLMLNGSLDEFLDALDFAPTGVLDLIKTMSVSLPLNDIQKREALKKKTGFDCDAALKHVMEEKEDDEDKIVPNAPERRVKKDEAAPAGRRTTPKYNVVEKDAEKTAE